MTASDRKARTIVVWEVRLGTALPVSPFVTGALVSILLILGIFGWHGLLGMPVRDPGAEELFGLMDTVRNGIFVSVFLGYVIAGSAYGSLGVARDLGQLGLDPSAGREIPASKAVRFRLAGAIGVAGGVLLLIGIQRSLGFPISNLWMREVLWFALLVLLLSFTVARSAYAALQGPPPGLVDVARAPVDLLDLRAFHTLGRIALRNALLFVIGISLFVPFVLIPGYTETFAVIMAASLVMPTLALLLPVRGVRGRIRQARRAELARLEAELRRLRDDPEPPGRLADLYAQRAYVESVREWPFDTSTLARFGLYLLIPLASWVGSALVERLVDVIVD